MKVRTTLHLTNEELTRKNSFVEIIFLGEGAVRANIRLRNKENNVITTCSFWKGNVEASIKAANAFYSTFLG